MAYIAKRSLGAAVVAAIGGDNFGRLILGSLIGLTFGIGCNDPASPKDHLPDSGAFEPQYPDTGAPTPDEPKPAIAPLCTVTATPALTALRSQLKKSIARAECAGDTCEMVSIRHVPAAPSDASLGSRILVLDDDILVAAATRYLNRTIGFLGLEEDGTYTDIVPELEVPAPALETFEIVEEYAGHTRAEDLHVEQEFFAGPGASLPMGHGTDILGFIADYVPNAQLVVTEDQPQPPYTCELLALDDNAAWQSLEQYKENMKRSLADSIRKYSIDVVNLSWGLTHETISRFFENLCNVSAPLAVTVRIQKLWLDLFEAMVAARAPEELVLFQAGASVSSDQQTRGDNLIDCAPLTGRVRVMALGYAGFDVGESGSQDYSLISGDVVDRRRCSDVFVVMGRVGLFGEIRSRGVFGTRPYSMGVFSPSWPPASSFASPVALAHYFYLKQQNPTLGPRAIANALTQDGQQPILDPLLHGQLPDCVAYR